VQYCAGSIGWPDSQAASISSSSAPVTPSTLDQLPFTSAEPTAVDVL